MTVATDQARARRDAIRYGSRKATAVAPLIPYAVETEESVRAADLSIDKLVLDGIKRKTGTKKRGGKRIPIYTDTNARVEGSLLDAVVERTVEGASTLTLTIHDPEWALLASGIFDTDDDLRLDAIDVKLDKLWFRLVKVNPSGNTLTLTFEDRDVSILRGHDKPRSVARKDRTRAQFVELLCREVKQVRIRLFSPEKSIKQHVGKVVVAKSKKNDDRGITGFARGQRLTVKNHTADAAQRHIYEMGLQEADKVHAPDRAMLALLIALVAESEARNLKGGMDSSVGPLQLLDMHGSVSRRRNTRLVCRQFLTKGFTGAGGAIALARKHPGMHVAEIAATVQGNRDGALSYAPWVEEAKRTLRAWGHGVHGSTSTSRTRIKQYRFKRGDGSQREDSWTCMLRLASEVNWRCFMRSGRVWFVSEAWLLKQRVLAIVHRGSRGIDPASFTFDWDVGKKIKSVTFDVSADRWDFPPGSVIEVEKSGPANGRYIVNKISKSLYSPLASVTLTKAVQPKPEPAPETETVSTRSGGSGSLRGGSVRQRIVEVARRSMTSRTHFSRYSQAGRLTTDPTPPAGARTDCSQWVYAVYAKAGAGNPGTWTGDMARRGKRTSRPKPGDILLTASHCEIYIGNGRTIGHGSPPIDYGKPSFFPGHWFVTYPFLDK